MAWSIEYYSSNVEKSILELPEGLLARYIRPADLMLEFGVNLGMPQKIIMLHMFVKKSQKTPNKELKVAFERMKEVISNDA